jgi:hypothetical protein
MRSLFCLLLLLAEATRLCSGREEGWNWGRDHDQPAQEGVPKTFQIKFRLLSLKHFQKNEFCAQAPAPDGPSVADPDPGSGAFLTPGSGIRNRFFPDPGSRISDPKPIFFKA